MAIDESTTIKTPTAKRTKNIIQLGVCKIQKNNDRISCYKKPIRFIYTMLFFRSLSFRFASYYSFRNRYAIMKSMHVRGRTIQVVHKFQNLSELSDTVKPFSYRVLKEDCLDLPPKNFTKRHIVLTSDQKNIRTNEKRSYRYIKW